KPPDRVAQRRLGHAPEVLVATHQRAEPRVLELLLAPGRREGRRVARDLAARLDDRMDVEERAGTRRRRSRESASPRGGGAPGAAGLPWTRVGALVGRLEPRFNEGVVEELLGVDERGRPGARSEEDH